MNDIQVSVIVPIYNVESYLPTCLDSLLNQTLPHLEVLLVNDGSTDRSAAIAREYEAKHPHRFRVLDKENAGPSAARNYALPYARGEYITFVDSDDYVEADMYAQMLQTAQETDSDVVVCAYAEVRNGSVTPLPLDADAYGHSVTESPRILDSAIIYNVLGTANKVTCVNHPFYHYTVKRAGSITGAVNEHVFDVLLSVDSILHFYDTLPQTPALREQVYCLCLRHALVRLQNFPRTNKRRLARTYIRRCYAFLDERLPGWQACSLLHPPASASLKKKALAFIKRHRRLASICYVGIVQYALLTLYDKVRKRT